jgi:hypothetical protein
MIPVPKKRGRPAKTVQVETIRSDVEIIQDLSERFSVLSRLTHGAVNGNIRSLVVSGAPGVGKSYTVENILSNSDIPYEIVSGGISAVHLYKLGYRMRKPGSVIVLDDSDSIFTDEEAINILKAMCDTSPIRKVSWLKDSPTLRQEDDQVPTDYDFEGSIIFISNLDFSAFVEENRNKFSQHFEALISRAFYLDLRLHKRDEIAVWINHVATSAKLFLREGITEAEGNQALAFISNYRHKIRVLSIRTLVHLCQLIKSEPNTWYQTARVTLCRA